MRNNCKQDIFNPFHTTGLFRYPQKTENQRFLMFSWDIEKEQWHEMVNRN